MSAQRVDELYPSPHQTLGDGQYMSSNTFVKIASPTMRVGSSGSREPIELDFSKLTGLIGDLRIKWQPNNGSFPGQILELIVKCGEFQKLPENWDSYGGLPLAAGCIRPAFALVLELHERCLYPEMVLLGSGGMGLRWSNVSKRLEIDFEPDGTCEALLLDDLSAEPPIEFEGEANVNSLNPILAAFR